MTAEEGLTRLAQVLQNPMFMVTFVCKGEMTEKGRRAVARALKKAVADVREALEGTVTVRRVDIREAGTKPGGKK